MTSAAGRRPAAPPGRSPRRRRSSRSRASRRRTRPRTCRPSRSPGSGPPRSGRRGRCPSATPASPASSRSPKPARLAVARSDIASSSAGSARRAAGRRHVRLEGDGAPHLRHEPRGDAGRRLDRRAAGRRAAAGRGSATAASPTARGTAQDDRGGAPLGQPGGLAGLAVGVHPADRRGDARRRASGSSAVDREHGRDVVESSACHAGSSASGPAPACSRPRSALFSAAPNVRSMAITSPVAFIWRAQAAVGRRGTCRTGSAAA